MKVLHFSALDGQTGAGIAAARIHEGLRARGVTSRFCVAHPAVGLVDAFTPNVSGADRVSRMVRRAASNWIVRHHADDYDYVLSSGLVGFDIGKIVAQERPDIVQLHWIGGTSFRLESLSGIRVPVVWRLSDMWGFCSLEHLQPDPQKYVDPPRRGFGMSRPFFDFSDYVRYRKLATYRTIRQMTITCPSRWLAAEVRRSALLGDREVKLIPTSCDTSLFSPKDRSHCREVLGLPQDKIIVLVGATSTGTRWKGLDLFVEAMKRLENKPSEQIQVVTFGHAPVLASELMGSVGIEQLGPVGDRRLMSILYNAADVFVAPSRMENLANTVLESLASGTPVVAFDVGGMPDMIEHRRNGFLAAPFDTSQLAEGIRWVIDQRGDDKIRQAARGKVLNGFSLEQEIELYMALYGCLLAPAA